MFESIGHMRDPEHARRRAHSLLITALIQGSVVGLLAWQAAQIVDPLEKPRDTGEIILVDFDPPAKALEVPTLPPAGGGGGGERQGTADDPTKPEPDVEPDVPPKLDDDVRPEVKSTKPTLGNPALPTGPGKGPGQAGPGTCAMPPCGDDPTVMWVHHTELKPRTKPRIQYPEAARSMTDLGAQYCDATVFIDENGRPYDVTVAGCPALFREAAEEGLLRWRWYPPRDASRQRVKARTRVRITFRLDELGGR